jgi:hypothetical protein
MHTFYRTSISTVILATVLALVALPAAAQKAAESSGTVPVTTVVTVLGDKFTAPPAVSKSDVTAYQQNKKVDVTDFVPAQGDKAALQLAILIDDADDTSFAIQLNDLRAFVNSQPPSTAVGVFYANNGTIQATSQFSTAHDAVAKSIRIPFGYSGASSSIYYSIQDLIKRWPVTPGSRREILLLSDGANRFHGDYPINVDLQPTIDKAQTAGIIIHSIYVTGVGHLGHSLFRINLAQGNLSQMTDATGGHAFFQGLQTPVALAPFLDQLNLVLKNQYWLTIAANRTNKRKGELQRFKVITELKDLDLDYPTSVFIPLM